VRNNYVKAVREAEAAIREMRKAIQNEGPRPEIVMSDSQESETSTKTQSTESPWETSLRMYGRKYGVSPDRLIALLNEVQSLEAEYKKLVKDENDAVSQAQTMEIMALEAAQKLEEVSRISTDDSWA
jgi:Sec-independent protein translocase protein TatA